jgi:hypothetical protein
MKVVIKISQEADVVKVVEQIRKVDGVESISFRYKGL